MFTSPCRVFVVPEFPFGYEIAVFYVFPFFAFDGFVEFVDFVELGQLRTFVQLFFSPIKSRKLIFSSDLSYKITLPSSFSIHRWYPFQLMRCHGLE